MADSDKDSKLDRRRKARQQANPPDPKPDAGSLRDRMRRPGQQATPPSPPGKESVQDKRQPGQQTPPPRPAAKVTPQLPPKPAAPPAKQTPATPPAKSATPAARTGPPPAGRPAATTPPAARPASAPAQRPDVRPSISRAITPMPPPPARHPVRQRAIPSNVSDEVRTKIERVQNQFAQLESEAQLSSVYTTIGRLDTKLTELPFSLGALRTRGYVHAGQLEARLAALDDRWEKTRPRVETTLRQQVRQLDTELTQTAQQLGRVSANNVASVTAAETAVNSLSRRLSTARDAVAGLYAGMENELNTIESGIQRVSRMLDLLDQAPEIRLRTAEAPLLAVNSRWQTSGKEGPEGVLFLTDQRLIFEQREEIVTKKRLGIFKAESEKIQKVLLDVQMHEIESVTHKEEGGFLGMGKDDILELVLAASASASRARFHIKGQDSSDWAATIKRVQTGDINKDRASGYMEEVAAAAAVTFPAQCPGCFAPFPPPPRGVMSAACEFCGTVVMPISE